MIEFMLLAAPRSGTTWASVWLTTDKTLCLHDPLHVNHYSELDTIKTDKNLGVSCTGLLHFTDWVNSHPARKIILHRDLNEINESLSKIGLLAGLPEISMYHVHKLNSIKGIHLPWQDLFQRPKFIYEYLLQLPFDEERHSLLTQVEMQPNFEGLRIDYDVTRRLFREIGLIFNEKSIANLH